MLQFVYEVAVVNYNSDTNVVFTGNSRDAVFTAQVMSNHTSLI